LSSPAIAFPLPKKPGWTERMNITIAVLVLALPFAGAAASRQDAAPVAAPVLAPVPAQADGQAGEPAQEQMQAVSINGTRNPELKSYRTMMAGVDAFDEHHELAPAAPGLHFRLVPNAEQDQAKLEGITLRIAGNGDAIAVPVAADGKFALPRLQAALDDDADLILNRKKKLLGWAPDVRSEGVPAEMRRLGDLRLECEVGLAIAKKELNLLQRAAAAAAMLGAPPCQYRTYSVFGFSAPRALKAVTLVAGERRLALPLRGRDYLAPLPDKSWPDDALVEFQFADEGSATSASWSLAR
jgi:hypothetical protein